MWSLSCIKGFNIKIWLSIDMLICIKLLLLLLVCVIYNIYLILKYQILLIIDYVDLSIWIE